MFPAYPPIGNDRTAARVPERCRPKDKVRPQTPKYVPVASLPYWGYATAGMLQRHSVASATGNALLARPCLLLKGASTSPIFLRLHIRTAVSAILRPLESHANSILHPSKASKTILHCSTNRANQSIPLLPPSLQSTTFQTQTPSHKPNQPCPPSAP